MKLSVLILSLIHIYNALGAKSQEALKLMSEEVQKLHLLNTPHTVGAVSYTHLAFFKLWAADEFIFTFSGF